jgi:hypothetical protein
MYFDIFLLLTALQLFGKPLPSAEAYYIQISSGYANFRDNNINDRFNANVGWFRDNRTIWIEYFWDSDIDLNYPSYGFGNRISSHGFGFRVSYPFSGNKDNTFYIGGGGGASLVIDGADSITISYAFFTESTAGYSMKIFQKPYRIEAYMKTFIYNKLYSGLGARFVMELTTHKPSER